MTSSRHQPKPDYKAIFISDVHLGSAGCQADALCAFLKTHTSQQLYLVGDIIDGWRMRKKWYWPQSHTNVIRRILTAAKRGTEVTYIIGIMTSSCALPAVPAGLWRYQREEPRPA